MGLTDDWRQVLTDATALAKMKRDLKDRAEEILRLQQEIRRMERKVAQSKEQYAAAKAHRVWRRI
jgi:uncharacterized protein involved in exopolysaccharide biosynthesis